MNKQRGFAAPALFVAVAIAFLGSLGVKGENGETLAQGIGLVPGTTTEFAGVEPVDATARAGEGE